MALLRASSQAMSRAWQLQPVRMFAGEGLKGFSEHERTVEDLYFTKEDQRLFSKLLNKVKQQSDIVDQHAAAGVKAAELSALKNIITKYNISTEDVEKLLSWKHTAF